MRRILWMGCAVLASGCVVREYRPPPPPPEAYRPPPPPPPPMVQPEVDVASVYVDPPVDQPPAVAIPWAPPPMRWDPPPPQPYFDAVWVGGHWTWWDGEWVWARGRWARPPTPGYVYCEPYYEYRGEAVVFVAGFWRPVVRVFVPPPPTVYVPLVTVRVVHVGYARPLGPHGVFVPPPPGSQPGVIIPAPVGTSPAVVLGAPPVVRPGMVVRPVPNRGLVEVFAPAGVTHEGRPVTTQAPVAPRDAAAVHPVVVAPPPPVRPAPTSVGSDRPAHGVAPSGGGPAPVPAPRTGLPAASPAPYGGEGQGGVIRRPIPSVGTPVPVQQNASPTPVRPLPAPGDTSGPAPLVRPVLRPDGFPAAGGAARPQPEAADPSGREGPLLRPVPPPRSEVGPRPPPVRSEAPAAQAAPPPVPSRVERAPQRPHPVPQRVTPEDRKGRPDPNDKER